LEEVVAEGLVVVGKLGVFGSEPVGFYELLAAHLGADTHTPYEVQKQIFPIQRKGRPGSGAQARIDDEMRLRTTRSIELGRSAIFDAYVNKPEKREALVTLAQELGATAVLIHPKARMVTVRERITRRHAAGQLPVFSDGATLESEFQLAGSMMYYLSQDDIHPDRNNVPHLCLEADGPVTAEELIPQVDAYIERLQRTPNIPYQRG
jgi:predicted kinase